MLLISLLTIYYLICFEIAFRWFILPFFEKQTKLFKRRLKIAYYLILSCLYVFIVACCLIFSYMKEIKQLKQNKKTQLDLIINNLTSRQVAPSYFNHITTF